MTLKKLVDYSNSLLSALTTKPKKGLYVYDSYIEYKNVQIEGNVNKIDKIWFEQNDILFLSKFLKSRIPNIMFGICHGTRRGEEQKIFREQLEADVIGTEISPTASQFPHTIEWDFHDVKEEWLDNVDFIYSNAFDHSYKPKECLDAWMSCVKNNTGLLILEWTSGHAQSTKLDPFGAGLDEYIKLGNGKYKVVDILKSPNNRFWKLGNRYFVVIKHR